MLEIGQVFLYNNNPVLITSGYYMGQYGISNWWEWRRIKKDGSLGVLQKGYDNEGKFKPYNKNFEIKIILNGK